MRTRDILRAAARIVEQAWTKGAAARDKDGRKCPPKSPKAVSWSAWGAIHKVAPDVESALRALNRADKLARAKHGTILINFNDYIATSPQEVAAFLREAAR